METLTLFDLGAETKEEVVTKKEKPKKTATPKKTAAKKVEKPEPKPEVKVKGDWTIHFATEQFLVSDFVEEIPEEGITLEELRVELEKSYAQFSAARTKWDVDEENSRLFPDAFAGSKGGHSLLRGPLLASISEAKNTPQNIVYVPRSDGRLYVVKKSPIGQMIADTKAEVEQRGEDENIFPSFTFGLPKMPKSILEQALSFFKAYTRKGDYEVMLRVYWDIQEAAYVVECPEQKVTRTHIDCLYDTKYTGRNQLRYMVVMEIHSHNVMRAFFSDVDDRDEQRFGLYGVIGRLNRPQPEMILRVKSNDDVVTVPVSDVFELGALCHRNPYPSEWDEKVRMVGGAL